MKSMTVAISVLVFNIAFTNSSLSQDLCGDVLSSNVFNTGETSSVVNFASSFKDVMCKSEWTSSTDISSRSKDFGFSFSDISRSLGLNSETVNDAVKRNSAYKDFCEKSVEDIAYSSQFFQKYRTSDVAVSKWSECIKTKAEGHFSVVVPDLTLTGAVITLTKRASGSVPDLNVTSIQSSSENRVECLFNEINAVDAVFPKNTREISLTCLKQADDPVTFTINTNWGNFGPISLQGYTQSLQELQLSIARLRREILSQVNALQQVDARISAGQSCRWIEIPTKAPLRTSASCSPGEYIKSVIFSHQAHAPWWTEKVQYECCSMLR